MNLRMETGFGHMFPYVESSKSLIKYGLSVDVEHTYERQPMLAFPPIIFLLLRRSRENLLCSEDMMDDG
jgi:hypothetical protein